MAAGSVEGVACNPARLGQGGDRRALLAEKPRQAGDGEASEACPNAVWHGILAICARRNVIVRPPHSPSPSPRGPR
eukprot:1598396-Prymnesium_polylepis.1